MTDFFSSNGFIFNKEGDNNLQECYLKVDNGMTEFYSQNENEGQWDHVIMNQDFDVVLTETVTL